MQKIQMVDLHTQYLEIKEEINAAIQETLDATNFIKGSPVSDFERELAEFLGGEYVAEVRELEAAIHKLVVPNPAGDAFTTVLERARELESRFAVKHPVAERFMAEIMDTLARMGI